MLRKRLGARRRPQSGPPLRQRKSAAAGKNRPRRNVLLTFSRDRLGLRSVIKRRYDFRWIKRNCTYVWRTRERLLRALPDRWDKSMIMLEKYDNTYMTNFSACDVCSSPSKRKKKVSVKQGKGNTRERIRHQQIRVESQIGHAEISCLYYCYALLANRIGGFAWNAICR